VQECIFCKVIKKEIPSEIVYEDEHILAFKDIKPAAPVHLLIIPKKHITSLSDLHEEDAELMGRIQIASVHLARQMGLAEQGFRVVCNCGHDGGQMVMHIHYHLLAGRQMQWPPG